MSNIITWKGCFLFSKLSRYFFPEIKKMQLSDMKGIRTCMQIWMMSLEMSDSYATGAHKQLDKSHLKQQNN